MLLQIRVMKNKIKIVGKITNSLLKASYLSF